MWFTVCFLVFIFYSGVGLHQVCAGFCFLVVPYVFLAILAFVFVFLWGCLVDVVFIHVLGFLFIYVFYLLNSHIQWVLLYKGVLFSYYCHFFQANRRTNSEVKNSPWWDVHLSALYSVYQWSDQRRRIGLRYGYYVLY